MRLCCFLLCVFGLCSSGSRYGWGCLYLGELLEYCIVIIVVTVACLYIIDEIRYYSLKVCFLLLMESDGTYSFEVCGKHVLSVAIIHITL